MSKKLFRQIDDDEIGTCIVKCRCYHIPRNMSCCINGLDQSSGNKKIFVLSFCTMVANNRKTHLRAGHYHLLEQHYKSNTLKPINLAISAKYEGMFYGWAFKLVCRFLQKNAKAVILMCPK